ncbi:MAG: chemotaxis protein CheD [Deltaproteobacteria bacterium]|nr:chemotaxis protein CheD [Deltaproteobacteria bacterium]
MSQLAANLFVEPGYVCLPARPGRLWSVVASGVIVTIFDRLKRRGGMGHYLRPFRQGGSSTTFFAAPAIVSLVRMFEETGTPVRDLEAHLCGGAINPAATGYEIGQAENNVAAGRQLLAKLGVNLGGEDVGGGEARKIVFDAVTGQIVIAKVPRVRESDWYPPLPALEGH